jgi:hypothetical protein
MENLPQNVINKIMFFLRMPTASIMMGSQIYYYMKLRLDKEDIYTRGSSHDCGLTDGMHRFRFFDPRRYTILHGQKHTSRNIPYDEWYEYLLAYRHGSSCTDMTARYSIKPTPLRMPEDSDLDSSDTSDTDSI